MTADILSAAAGSVAGAMLAAFVMYGRVRAARASAERLGRELAEAGAAAAKLAELRAGLSSLRHDVRGILSPAMLVSDRLLSHAEPGVRRAGEVMIRVVERATARLAGSQNGDVRPATATAASDEREQLDTGPPT